MIKSGYETSSPFPVLYVSRNQHGTGTLIILPHLIQGGLTDAVVHNPEPLLVAFNLMEDGIPRYIGPGELVANSTLREGGREGGREEGDTLCSMNPN